MLENKCQLFMCAINLNYWQLSVVNNRTVIFDIDVLTNTSKLEVAFECDERSVSVDVSSTYKFQCTCAVHCTSTAEVLLTILVLS